MLVRWRAPRQQALPANSLFTGSDRPSHTPSLRLAVAARGRRADDDRLAGLEHGRIAGLQRDECVTTAMLDGFDRDLLMCSNSRLVTDRGVWVCPLLVEQPDARLGTTLDDAASSYELRHQACVTCWRYGTICGNVSALIEGPDPAAAPEARR